MAAALQLVPSPLLNFSQNGMLSFQEWLETKPSDGMEILHTGLQRNY